MNCNCALLCKRLLAGRCAGTVDAKPRMVGKRIREVEKEPSAIWPTAGDMDGFASLPSSARRSQHDRLQ